MCHDTDIVIQEKAYLHDINEYTKLDPTSTSNNIILGVLTPRVQVMKKVQKDDIDRKQRKN